MKKNATFKCAGVCSITVEIIGWYGTIAILTAYALVSFGFLPAGSLWYQLLNLTGACGMIAVSVYKNAYQPAALNAVWFLVALLALLQMLVR